MAFIFLQSINVRKITASSSFSSAAIIYFLCSFIETFLPQHRAFLCIFVFFYFFYTQIENAHENMWMKMHLVDLSCVWWGQTKRSTARITHVSAEGSVCVPHLKCYLPLISGWIPVQSHKEHPDWKHKKFAWIMNSSKPDDSAAGDLNHPEHH